MPGQREFNGIRVYYSHFWKPLSLVAFDNYLQLLPIDQQIKNGRLLRWQDRHAHLYSRLQLIEGLKSFGIADGGLMRIQYDPNHRPFLAEGVDFNISHCDGYVICAIGMGMRLGVDIEFYRKIEVEDYRVCMDQFQWEDILHSKDQASAFLGYWTKKEAVVKADGRGMGISLRDVYFENGVGVVGNCRWPLYEIRIGSGCEAWLACNIYNTEIELVEYFPPGAGA